MNPLDQLSPIYTPPPPSWWPPAPGWWISAVLIMSALLLGGYFLRRAHRNKSYRRNALKVMDKQTDNPLPQRLVAQLNLVRRTARHTNPASSWPSLDNIALLQAIDGWSGGKLSEQTQNSNGKALNVTELGLSTYQPGAINLSLEQIEQVEQQIGRWVSKHSEVDVQ